MTAEWAVVAAALIGASASPFGAWLVSYWTAKREAQSRTRDARYFAVRVAVLLEQFAIECADYVSDQELYKDSVGYAGRQHCELPQLPVYPDEADWKALDPNLLARALSLRNELTLSGKTIAFWGHVDRDCIPGECEQQCGRCGYMAWQLAADMRHHYGLPTFDPARSSLDAAGALKPLHDKVLSKTREHAELDQTADGA